MAKNRLAKWAMAVLSLASFVTLCFLGNWQVQRLEWKETLVAQIDQRMASNPVSLREMQAIQKNGKDVDYRTVTVTGIFDHDNEAYYYNTNSGVVGWNVFTPLKTDGGLVVLVNRGFVPEPYREPATRAKGQVTGIQSITGLARTPPSEKPNSFMPENDITANIFFWKDLPAMAAKMEQNANNVVPFFIDAGEGKIPGGYPRGGTTRVSFPNNHLQYAVTWYGLAFGLVLVSGFFLWSNRKSKSDNDA
ncbi:MAG: SURF1 family protein [Rhizobiaceae bacterium]